MDRYSLWKGALLLLLVTLAACDGSAAPTTVPTAEGSPTSACPSSGEITKSLATPQPADVLLELAWEGGLTRPELAYAFGRVPEFSLLPDGSVYYLDPPEIDRAQVMVAHLTPAGTQELVQRVLDLGFERLESYTEQCQPQADGTCMCVADAGQSVLRVRLPIGELREIRNYGDFANDPETLAAIRTFLQDYQHPQAEVYKPDTAALYIRSVPPSSDLPSLDWPLPPSWLSGGALDASCVKVLSGGDLQVLLAATEQNLGDFYFRDVGASQVYNVYLVPWLPGVDYADLIASSGQACPPAGTVTLPCAPASGAALASRLIVEEHPLKVGPMIRQVEGPYFETTDGDTPEVLAKNEAYGDAAAVLVGPNNELLQPFGYRIEVKQCARPGVVGEYVLHKDDNVYLAPVYQFSPVAVNSAGTDFVMTVDGTPLTADGSSPEAPTVYVGDEPLAYRDDVVDEIQVTLGNQVVYKVHTKPDAMTYIQGLWSYEDHWVMEMALPQGTDLFPTQGQIIQDGRDLNAACGYKESFNFALPEGRPFYFYREGLVD
jgi:hypothetical protein